MILSDPHLNQIQDFSVKNKRPPTHALVEVKEFNPRHQIEQVILYEWTSKTNLPHSLTDDGSAWNVTHDCHLMSASILHLMHFLKNGMRHEVLSLVLE